MSKPWDAIWINANLVTCEKDNEILSHAAIATQHGKIAWLGSMEDLPQSPEMLAETVIDVEGRCLTPGFIDCHTHLVYGGNRAHEFELRLQGATYAEIAAQGGGIQATVDVTRQETEDHLFAVSLARARTMLHLGTTTIEMKSGYGLDCETELKCLRVAKRIAAALPVTVSRTYLGAHLVPAEYQGKVASYLDLVCEEMIPHIAREKLADAVDVFCEKMAFDLSSTERVFAAAKKYDLGIKCHAEQLSESGSLALAAGYKAWSVDHLEYATLAGIQAIARSGTVAVLLPGAFYCLKETKLPPIDWLRQYRVPIALATDCNPGTSPILSLPLILNMACTLYRLTPAEALAGVTRHAARALRLEHTHGTLTVGKVADFAIWDAEHPVEVIYYLGNQPLHAAVKGGIIASESQDEGTSCT